MSEDGYLMQTVARNMAIGLGMSTAEGTIPTNGVQPLATFAYAGLHALAGGSNNSASPMSLCFLWQCRRWVRGCVGGSAVRACVVCRTAPPPPGSHRRSGSPARWSSSTR